MKMRTGQTMQTDSRKRDRAAHTLVEVMVALGVSGFMLVALYAGFSAGFSVLRLARENLRATQILAERMEVVRLVKWTDVNPGFIPGSFTAPFFANDTNGSAVGGFNYSGTVVVTNAPLSESYAGDLRMIQITVNWNSGGSQRARQMTTYVSKYGLQNYIY
jgi:type II secretory pathway pseudopilin PulG